MSPSSTSGAIVSEVPPADRLATLPPWPWDPMDPAAPRTLGFAVASWVEGRRGQVGLTQPNGPRAGQPFRLTGDQLRFLLWWYALDAAGDWLFMHGVRRLAKGSGKSPFAAVLALVEFCGPCRLDRFDSRVPGGARAKPVLMPLVQIAATAESQTANTMRMVRAFAPKKSAFVEHYQLDAGKTIYYKLPEGTLEVITSSFTAAEGAESTFVIGDETEHWKPANGGPTLASTLEDNLAKSGSRMLETSNAWEPGGECVAEGSWDSWLAQEEGRLVDGAGRILYDARIAPPDTDIADYDSLERALRWVYGDCEWRRGPDGEIDVRPIIKRILNPKAKVPDSKRKYLNRPTAAEDAWVEPEQWHAMADLEVQVAATDEVALFFDGSKSRDATAIVGCRISDGFVFVPRWHGGRTVWEPDPSHDTDDVVPVAEVDAAVEDLFGRYDVVGFFGDVAEWESFVKVEWPRRHGDRLRVKAQPTGKDPQVIAWDMRSHTMDFTREVELVEAEILEGLFAHDGDPVLARHVTNMRRRPNRYGVSVGKETRDSPKKIDAGVCMIGARMVRRLVLAAAPSKKRSGVVVGVR
jgi:hypothetical protein